MHTTRSTILRRLVGVVALPTLVFAAAACGGDDDDSAAGGGGDTESFCDAYTALDEEMSELDVSDTEAFGEAFDEAVGRMEALDPPAEIADDWETMMDALSEIDMSDPTSIAGDDFADAEAASERIDSFLTEECEA